MDVRCKKMFRILGKNVDGLCYLYARLPVQSRLHKMATQDLAQARALPAAQSSAMA